MAFFSWFCLVARASMSGGLKCKYVHVEEQGLIG